MIHRSKDLKNVIKSLTMNWLLLTKTLAFGIIVMYLYAVIAFNYFAQDFTHCSDGSQANGKECTGWVNYCYNLRTCFSTVINNGLRSGGGIGEALSPVYYGIFFTD